MDREIELKFLFAEQQREILVAWLNEHAVYEGSLQQEDRYFDNPHRSFFTKNEQGVVCADSFLRVRFTNKGDYVCLKNWHHDAITLEKTHCDEYETSVASGQTMCKLLQAEGYELDTIIIKERNVYRYDCFEVAIDQVKGLGSFVEVELKDYAGAVDAGRAAIKQFVKNIGIGTCVLQRGGYVVMAKNPGINFGETIIL